MESTTALDVGLEALDLLTVGEVAARMRVSPVTVRRLIASGDLEAVAGYKASLRGAARRAGRGGFLCAG
jgi:hypothetical protein